MFLSYSRVSTIEQAADGTTSLAEQTRRNKAIADLRDVPFAEFARFVDAGVSGTIPLAHRPAGKAMLAAAKAGDIICANKLDRLFRSASDALATAEKLRQRGVDLILIDMGTEAVTGNGAAKMFFGMLALVAEFERERIAERMHEGRKAKAAKSGHIGGDAPYGYTIDGQGRSATLVPLEHEQEVVRKAREMKRMRLRLCEITSALNEMGHRNRLNSPFRSVQVLRILRNGGLYGNGATG